MSIRLPFLMWMASAVLVGTCSGQSLYMKVTSDRAALKARSTMRVRLFEFRESKWVRLSPDHWVYFTFYCESSAPQLGNKYDKYKVKVVEKDNKGNFEIGTAPQPGKHWLHCRAKTVHSDPETERTIVCNTRVVWYKGKLVLAKKH